MQTEGESLDCLVVFSPCQTSVQLPARQTSGSTLCVDALNRNIYKKNHTPTFRLFRLHALCCDSQRLGESCCSAWQLDAIDAAAPIGVQ